MVPTNPVIALGFVLAGASLVCYWLAETKPAHKWKWECGRAKAVVLVAIGALELDGYILGWHLVFGQMLFRTQLQNDRTDSANQTATKHRFQFYHQRPRIAERQLVNSSAPPVFSPLL